MKLFTEFTSRLLVWIGISLFCCGIILFLWNENALILDQEVDSTKIGQFGDYVGGIIGSLWALAGVILFYVALTEQRKDIRINRETLQIQVDALEQQIKEFELQRAELELTRDVFIEQSKTLKKQQFESSFFNSVNLLNQIIDSIHLATVPKIIGYKESKLEEKVDLSGRICFEYLYNVFRVQYIQEVAVYVIDDLQINFSPDEKYKIPLEKQKIIIQRSYDSFHKKYQAVIGHYFRTTYNIIKFVKDRSTEAPKYYTNLVRAQLSSYEHLLLFYNCLSQYGHEKFKPLLIEYSLLNNMPKDELFDYEHLKLYPERAYE